MRTKFLINFAAVALIACAVRAAEEPQQEAGRTEETPAMKELAALAQKTKLPTPMRIVCLGDSITQQYPHQKVKYPEMLQIALKAKYGEEVQVINAGRGGDNVPSALRRLEADVINKKPNLVFVNLGINDSKLLAPAYERNAVPIEQFRSGYEEIVKAIGEKCNAQVVAVGTIACVEEWTKRPTERAENKGNWFGKPEELQRYNAAVQEIAKAHGIDYVDLYEHFRAQPDIKALFREPDGVHCRDRGQEQIALQLMRYLVKRYPAP